MLNRIALAALCAVIPATLYAQEVELRSTDGFISVEGEIVGFENGLVSINTSIGVVRVPASEVVCYGIGCTSEYSQTSFGITADVFDGVAGPDGVYVPNAAVATAPGSENLTIAFASAEGKSLFGTLAGAFAVDDMITTSVDLTAPGQIILRSTDGNQQATFQIASAEGVSDDALNIQTKTLRGAAPAQYAGPAAWSGSTQVAAQLFALDAYSVVIAPDVGIDAISVNDLARIYAGELVNWSELGGPDKKILPLQLPAGSKMRDNFIKLVMDPAGKTIAQSVLTMANEQSIAQSVQQFPGSISIVGVGEVANNVTLPVAGSCGIPVSPSTFNIISGDYPLLRPIMATYAEPPKTLLPVQLFDFASSGAVEQLVANAGYFSQQVVLQDEGVKNERLGSILGARLEDAEKAIAGQMFQTLLDAERLSPTMIGGSVSVAEGAWNRSAFLHLKQALDSGIIQGSEIMFIGFATSTDGPTVAIDTANDAAADMLAAFQEFAPYVAEEGMYSMTSMGFGRLAPATCYDGQVESNTNSRVEIWVRS